jgi:hypothetical protein
MAKYDWLEEKHPIYIAGTTGGALGSGASALTTSVRHIPELTASQLADLNTGAAIPVGPWLRNERRLAGGDLVLPELKSYDWEVENGESHRSRQAQATYMNYPDIFATAMVGSIMRHAPIPDADLSFGTLGTVRRQRNIASPTKAEMIYYNATGPGVTGAQWNSFWEAAMKRAMATGHRWISVEAPPARTDRPRTQQDEIAGERPWLVEYSPLVVPNWDLDGDRLNFAIIRTLMRNVRLNNGKLEGNQYEKGYLLMVRAGFEGLGAEFKDGGWWKFSPDKELIPGQTGRYDRIDGMIPMFPLFYERNNGTDDMPAMSRSGLTEVGNIGISYMNMSSAADFDAVDAASSVQLMLGVTPEQFNIPMSKLKSGNRWVPVPPKQASALSTTPENNPDIYDGSTGAIAADVFERRLVRKEAEYKLAAAMEATSVPDSSGVSKVVGFNEVKNPRLALMANNMEEAQNTAIYLLERRWGQQQPTGYVTWRRDFDLLPLSDEIRSMMELEAIAGVSSPTVVATAMTKAVKEKRIITDDAELKKVETEYRADADSAKAAKEQERAMIGEPAVVE